MLNKHLCRFFTFSLLCTTVFSAQLHPRRTINTIDLELLPHGGLPLISLHCPVPNEGLRHPGMLGYTITGNVASKPGCVLDHYDPWFNSAQTRFFLCPRPLKSIPIHTVQAIDDNTTIYSMPVTLCEWPNTPIYDHDGSLSWWALHSDDYYVELREKIASIELLQKRFPHLKDNPYVNLPVSHFFGPLIENRLLDFQIFFIPQFFDCMLPTYSEAVTNVMERSPPPRCVSIVLPKDTSHLNVHFNTRDVQPSDALQTYVPDAKKPRTC